MGEVVSYTKSAIDALFKTSVVSASMSGNNLVLEKTDGTTISVLIPIDSAISALIDSSPAALDTLNEIAAALGDDPNFSATVLNAVANVKQTAMGVVIHEANANTPRPVGYSIIHWIGTVSPLNAINNDLWTNPAV